MSETKPTAGAMRIARMIYERHASMMTGSQESMARVIDRESGLHELLDIAAIWKAVHLDGSSTYDEATIADRNLRIVLTHVREPQS